MWTTKNDLLSVETVSLFICFNKFAAKEEITLQDEVAISTMVQCLPRSSNPN